MDLPILRLPISLSPDSAPVLTVIYDEDGTFKNCIKKRIADLERDKTELQQKVSELQRFLDMSRQSNASSRRQVKHLEDKIEELENDKKEMEEEQEKPKRGRKKKELKQIGINVNLQREN